MVRASAVLMESPIQGAFSRVNMRIRSMYLACVERIGGIGTVSFLKHSSTFRTCLPVDTSYVALAHGTWLFHRRNTHEHVTFTGFESR